MVGPSPTMTRVVRDGAIFEACTSATQVTRAGPNPCTVQHPLRQLMGDWVPARGQDDERCEDAKGTSTGEIVTTWEVKR